GEGTPSGARCGAGALATVLLLTLAACGGAAPAAAPSQASAAVGASAAANSWEQVVAAAKKEGTLSLMSEGGNIPAALTDGFKKAYPDIQIDNVTGNGG